MEAHAAVARGDTNPFIAMLRDFKPPVPEKAIQFLTSGQAAPSAMKSSKPKTNKKKVRILPSTPEPIAGTRRAVKEDEPKGVPSDPADRFNFPAKWTRRRAKKIRAHEQIAQNDAEDLEDDVLHLWIKWEQDADSKSDGDPAAASPRRSEGSATSTASDGLLHLGSMRFIVDTGCGHNLLAVRYLRSAGAMGNLKQLKVPITLNTAGGPSRALGSVHIACDKLLEGKFETVVMPDTPSVISVGGLCLDHGYSFYWKAGKTPLPVAAQRDEAGPHR